jgi:hypothetical protein
MGPTAFLPPPPKEGVLLIFIVLKNPGFESADLGSNDKHVNHYTT